MGELDYGVTIFVFIVKFGVCLNVYVVQTREEFTVE